MTVSTFARSTRGQVDEEIGVVSQFPHTGEDGAAIILQLLAFLVEGPTLSDLIVGVYNGTRH